MENRLRNFLKDHFSFFSFSVNPESFVIDIEKAEFYSLCKSLFDELGFILLLDICGVDNLNKKNRNNNKRFEIIYHFLNLEEYQRLRVRIHIDEEDWIPSLFKIWPNSNWHEREIVDLLGLKFTNSSYKNLMQAPSDSRNPLRKDFNPKEKKQQDLIEIYDQYGKRKLDRSYDTVLWIENNPMISGNARLSFSLHKGRIKNSDIEIGYYHRGIEKEFENYSFEQGIILTDELNPFSSLISNFVWTRTLEEYLKIEITNRAKCIRMILIELSRVSEHLNNLGQMTSAMDAVGFHKICIENNEKILELLEMVTGSRYKHSFSRIGGLADDIPHGWISKCMETVQLIKSNMTKYSKVLIQSPSWLKKTRVGELSAYKALLFGFTGPNLRASGVNYDIRKSSPYYFYDKVDFNVVVGTTGDCYDRFLVRLEEIQQSIKIISQVLDNIPPGEVRVFSTQAKSRNLFDVQDFCKALENPRLFPLGEYYCATEAPGGELGFYFIADDSENPYRVKIRPPGFSFLQSYSELVNGRTLEEAKIILASLNIVISEIDR